MVEYPLSKFHFQVEWNGVVIGFTEVTGLDKQVEVIEYREGNSLTFSKIKMPGLQKYSNITFKRGTFAGKTEYYDWLKTVDKLRNAERRDITIKLLDEEHQPVLTWKALRAFPAKVQASDLKADGNEVAIETIEGSARRIKSGKIMAGYYPPAGFHFKVDFTNISTVDNDTRWQSVNGLSVEYETETHKEGGENRFEHVLPVRTKYTDLTLKRGFLAKDSKVFEWCMKAFTDREFTPADLLISLLDEEHQAIRTWNVVRAWPKKWLISELHAEQNNLVIETLELRYQYFKLN